MTCDFQQCAILTSVDSDEPVLAEIFVTAANFVLAEIFVLAEFFLPAANFVLAEILC